MMEDGGWMMEDVESEKEGQHSDDSRHHCDYSSDVA